MDDVWAKNIRALRLRNPLAADQLDRTEAHKAVVWARARAEDALSASVQMSDGRRLALCSAYRPLAEAQKTARKLDLQSRAVAAVSGFGAGHHIRALAERLSGSQESAEPATGPSTARGGLIVFEPDPSLLKNVLRKLDFSTLLASGQLELVLGPQTDQPTLIRRLGSLSGLIAQGVQFLDHGPTAQMHPEPVAAFREVMGRVVAFCRTTVMTTLRNSVRTAANLCGNLGPYAAGPTTDPLAGAAAGYPAVLVGAGPSLARNAHRLAEPGVRDRVVIITVQTALQPLLDRGVRPHFVTALDWSPISARFYEELPPLPDVTLVAEAKCHPSILDHYPGPIRLLQNPFLDRLLGDAARPIQPLPAGSTVAHLSFYLAQHLGCDPIVFIGQDLAFSEGLYYCPGTAIHRVWSSELNGFNSLEMMELKRILRHKTHLQERIDVHGRPCFSDEQMLTYLAQFERDFATAEQTLLDATEGGLQKAHTTTTTLAEALSAHARRPLPTLPKVETTLDTPRIDQARSVLRRRMDQVRRLRRNSLQTAPLLKQMLTDQRDEAKMHKHFQTLDRHRRQVQQEPEAMTMIDSVGQLIAFRRQRADRQISVSQESDPLKRQAMQLRRDIENVEWIAEACDETLEMFEEALGRLNRRTLRAGKDRS